MPLDLTDDKSTLPQVMLGAVRQQAITWADVDTDLCRHMASQGHNELKPGNLPVHYQTISWINADLLSTGPLGTNFSETEIKI